MVWAMEEKDLYANLRARGYTLGGALLTKALMEAELPSATQRKAFSRWIAEDRTRMAQLLERDELDVDEEVELAARARGQHLIIRTPLNYYVRRIDGNYSDRCGHHVVLDLFGTTYPSLVHDDTGEVVPLKDLMTRYGTTLPHELGQSLSFTESDGWRGRNLVTGFGAPIEPQFDPLVDGLLRAVFGDDQTNVTQYMARFRDLSKPCIALVLLGKPNAGKTFIARMLSAWVGRRGPDGTPLAAATGDALGGWGDSLQYTPVITLDESNDTKAGRLIGKALRNELEQPSRMVNVKGQPQKTLQGHIRIIMTANDILDQLSGSLGQGDDSDTATRERLWIVQAGDRAQEFVAANRAELEDLGTRGDHPDYYRRTSAHFAWLALQPHPRASNRFGVDSVLDEGLVHTVATADVDGLDQLYTAVLGQIKTWSSPQARTCKWLAPTGNWVVAGTHGTKPAREVSPICIRVVQAFTSNGDLGLAKLVESGRQPVYPKMVRKYVTIPKVSTQAKVNGDKLRFEFLDVDRLRAWIAQNPDAIELEEFEQALVKFADMGAK